MTDEELALSHSTPNHRFDKPANVPTPSTKDIVVTPEARAFVDAAIASTETPVTMFALTWCEFTWSVRKLFARCNIPYRAIDLDSVPYQANDLGAKVRAALTERTNVATIPQIFIGGSLVGGALDTFDAFASGRLQALLAEHRVPFEDKVGDKLDSLLPGWRHR
jgi:cysteine synthase A